MHNLIYIQGNNVKKDINQQDDSKTTEILDNQLNPLHLFENFVVGESNKFAFLAAKSICENFESLYNPLFIQGEAGTGKTHLLHAIGNSMQAKGKNIICVSVEKFLSEFTENLGNRTMDRFRKRYHECDLLLIDNLQFIHGKSQTQIELFHIFEVLLLGKKQIVITSNVNLKRMGGIEDGLKGQIQSGLEVNIQLPVLETKIEIIKKISEINQLQLDNEIINYIAITIENNAHQIQGIIAKIHAYSKLMKADISIELVRGLLEN